MDGKYDLAKKTRKAGSNEPMLTGKELASFYKDLCKDFPIKSIEDGFDEDDWESWTAFTTDVGKDIQIVGDDLTVTNPIRIEKAAKMGACNALLLKVHLFPREPFRTLFRSTARFDV